MMRLLLGFLLLTATLAKEGQDVGTQAASLWEKVLEAKGGKERLHGIESVLRSSRTPSKVRGRSYVAQVEELFVPPNQFWYWNDERPSALGLHARSVDFETKRAYSASPRDESTLAGKRLPGNQYLSVSVADPLQEAWGLEVMQAAELLETRWMELRPTRTWSETRGKVTSIFVECKFRMASGGATAVFTLDAITLLPKRVVVTVPLSATAPAWAVGVIPRHIDTVAHYDYEIPQYVDVSGIKMPTSLQHHDDGLNYQEKVQYQFNVDYDPALFERGPRIEDGPQGWRKRPN